MWTKFAREPWCRIRALQWPISLHFPAPDRRNWTDEQRVDELARWADIIGRPNGREHVHRAMLRTFGDILLRQNLATVQQHAALSAPLEREELLRARAEVERDAAQTLLAKARAGWDAEQTLRAKAEAARTKAEAARAKAEADRNAEQTLRARTEAERDAERARAQAERSAEQTLRCASRGRTGCHSRIDLLAPDRTVASHDQLFQGTYNQSKPGVTALILRQRRGRQGERRGRPGASP